VIDVADENGVKKLWGVYVEIVMVNNVEFCCCIMVIVVIVFFV